ncbi:MAG TPA: transcription-repair coupling factor, partial [Clostridiales bacterium]|nr:transcription-repair coupling factor [Clostridiales bacterium]
GGQVFYLHNHIDSIDSKAAHLQEMLPEARIMTAHGRMGEERLSEIWRKLVEQEIDILVCTTIIETGVDVPNCNTLIIEDADHLGLAQLYQLRGRVGRSNRRAYAYLTFRRGKSLSDVATKRLAAIREFTTFGSGFRIAMRDLEIRGAGNFLGAQQHGHMEAVGYDLYLKLLSEAVSEETGNQEVKPPVECMIDLQINAHIPESYIENLSQRIEIYKKIAAVQTPEDVLDLNDELIDRFGDPPDAVAGLVEVALVRNTASLLGFKEISQKDDKILFYPQELNMKQAAGVAAAMKGRVMVNAGAKPYLAVKIPKHGNPIDTIKETLETIRKVSAE